MATQLLMNRILQSSFSLSLYMYINLGHVFHSNLIFLNSIVKGCTMKMILFNCSVEIHISTVIFLGRNKEREDGWIHTYYETYSRN
jgi:hypothetical protein